MNAGVIWHEAYDDHDTGGHIEGPDRARAVITHLEESRPLAAAHGDDPVAGDAAPTCERVHTSDYVSARRSAPPRVVAAGSIPTPIVSRRSYEIALLAVGGALGDPASLGGGRGPASRSCVRPGITPCRARAMGFCLFNNVAILARTLLGARPRASRDRRLGRPPRQRHAGRLLRRPAASCSARCTSGRTIPGTRLGRRGRRRAPARASPSTCRCRPARATPTTSTPSTALIEPVVERSRRRPLLVSAGQDIHADDPLGSMRVTETGFAQMALRAAGLAARERRRTARPGARGRLRPRRDGARRRGGLGRGPRRGRARSRRAERTRPRRRTAGTRVGGAVLGPVAAATPRLGDPPRDARERRGTR